MKVKTNTKKTIPLPATKPLPVFIYCLVCPVSGLILYVGQSKQPRQRQEEALKRDDCTYKSEVLRAIKERLGMPTLHILEETTRRKAVERENYYIELAWRAGNPLLNVRVPHHMQKAYRQGNQRSRPLKTCCTCGFTYPNTAQYFTADNKQWEGLSADCLWCKSPTVPTKAIVNLLYEQYLANKPISL